MEDERGKVCMYYLLDYSARRDNNRRQSNSVLLSDYSSSHFCKALGQTMP